MTNEDNTTVALALFALALAWVLVGGGWGYRPDGESKFTYGE